jgi:prepilin-type N-terminal cleavage/methylation domain-containing protein
MMRHLRDERGMTLIELLVAMVASLIVFGATLAVTAAIGNNAQKNADHNEAQDRARTYMDRLARDLRNLASPSIFTDDYQAQPHAVDVAGAYDFVFRVVDERRPAGSLNAANVKRVRYCLDASRSALYQQSQTWTNRPSNDPPAMPSLASCPGTGWTTSMLVTSDVVNRADGQDRPLFVYNSTDAQRISQVHAELFVDPTPGRAPSETRLASGVTLRNQNRVPVASFSASPSAHALVLNGSASDDPEGMPLSYQWYVDPPSTLPDCGATPRPASCLSSGVVIDAALTPGTHRIVLLVKDPAGLPATAEQTIVIQ